MYCQKCGTKRNGHAAFCGACGERFLEGGRQQEEITPRTDLFPSSLVGFSSRAHDKEILRAAGKNKKSALGCAVFLLLAFPIGFLLAGIFMESMPLDEAMIIGVGLGLLMFVISIVRILSMKKNTWEGTVTDKTYKDKTRRDNSDNVTYYREYKVSLLTTQGKKKSIIEQDARRPMYDYLQVGDRVKYHPAFGTYEKYDKSRDRIIYCNICARENPMENERCTRCHNYLFK